MTTWRLAVAHKVDSGQDLEGSESVYLKMSLSTAADLVLC